MMMAVYGGVAVVGQAVKSPSDKTAMMIRVFMVALVRLSHFIMPVNEGDSVNLENPWPSFLMS
jgi:hypothetical protein